MRIYIDARINTFYIEGVSSGPTTDYVVTRNNDNISVFRNSTQLYDLYQVSYTSLTDYNNNPFPDAQTCLNYLTALTTYTAPIKAQPPLSIDSNNYLTLNGNVSQTFQFSTPALMWNINHNLGYIPVVLLFTLGSMAIEGDVLNISSNQVQITFNQPQAGIARIF